MTIRTDIPSVVLIPGPRSGKTRRYRLDSPIDIYWLITDESKSKAFIPNVPCVGVISGAGEWKNAINMLD